MAPALTSRQFLDKKRFMTPDQVMAFLKIDDKALRSLERNDYLLAYNLPEKMYLKKAVDRVFNLRFYKVIEWYVRKHEFRELSKEFFISPLLNKYKESLVFNCLKITPGEILRNVKEFFPEDFNFFMQELDYLKKRTQENIGFGGF